MEFRGVFILFISAASILAQDDNAQCLQTCQNLGCATGVYLPAGLFNGTSDPNCGGVACPQGCACSICNGDNYCQYNSDAVQYCESIGCVGADCDGGIINCLACPTTTSPKVTRPASDDANAACASACQANGCGSGFINNFPGAGDIGCTCVVCPASTPCSSVTTVTDYCASIGCIAVNNDPTGSWNTNANNANNACDFGISACYSCPVGTSGQPTPPPLDY
uniref:Uncharacterized protein n=1 Tax=Acrobeloides nanus TaxID=290746 RepID=A0A914CTR5_9BILA